MTQALTQHAVGVGFKSTHWDDLLSSSSRVDFIEVHAENYLGAGGLPHAQLRHLREKMPITIHGVGLSIGSALPLNQAHLDRVAALVARYQPAFFSEHLAWSSHGEVYFGDLLPLRYSNTLLTTVIDHVQHIQERLQRPILIENPSHYVRFDCDDFDEAEFLSALVKQTGCGLLLDINNLTVSGHNLNHNAWQLVQKYPLHAVKQIHLAGFSVDKSALDQLLWIDDHGSNVDDQVWTLYQSIINLIGATPTLIEWDNNVPDWNILLAEADIARELNDVRDSLLQQSY